MRCFFRFAVVFLPRLSVLTLAACLVLPAPAFCVEIPEELFQAVEHLGSPLSVLMPPLNRLFEDEEVKKLRRAAEQGDASAQTSLGWLYMYGQGVPQNDKEALKWFRLAAAQGYANGQYNVGLLYMMGRGVPQNYEEALKWFRLAAAQGHAAGRQIGRASCRERV